MSDHTWVPIALTEANYNIPAVVDGVKAILCVGNGYPANAKDVIKNQETGQTFGDYLFDKLNLQKRGEEGDYWYVAAPSLLALVGDAGAFGPERLERARAMEHDPDTTLIGEPVENPGIAFDAHGIPRPSELSGA